MHPVFLRLSSFFRDGEVAPDDKECTGRLTELLVRQVINYLIVIFYARMLSLTCDNHEIEVNFALQKIGAPHPVSPQFCGYHGRTFLVDFALTIVTFCQLLVRGRKWSGRWLCCKYSALGPYVLLLVYLRWAYHQRVHSKMKRGISFQLYVKTSKTTHCGGTKCISSSSTEHRGQ